MNKRLIVQSLTAATLITIGGNVLGRLLGFVREAVIAEHFGTSAILDTFILAFTLPEMLATVFFTALPVAAIPAMSENRQDDRAESRLFWSGLIWFAVGFLILAVLLGVFREQVIALFAPDLSAAHKQTGARLLLILSGYVFFRGLEAYFRSWCFARKRFVAPAVSTIIINISVVVAVFLLFDQLDIETLAWGWLVGSAVMATFNGIAAFRAVRPARFEGWSSPWLKVILQSLLAVAMIETISTLYSVIDRWLAARYLEPGPISALRYATTLVSIPTGVFVAAFNIAAFPWIADYTTAGQVERLKSLYVTSIRQMLFFFGLTACGMVIFAPDIVRVALQRGQFDEASVVLTAGPLAMFAAGMAFHCVYTFQMRFYYARKLLLRLGLIMGGLLLAKAGLSFLLVGVMQENGLALATTLIRLAGVTILTYDLSRFLGVTASDLLGRFAVRTLASLASVVGLWLLLQRLWPWHADTGLLMLLLRLMCLAAAGIGLHFWLGRMLGLAEPRQALNLLLRRQQR